MRCLKCGANGYILKTKTSERRKYRKPLGGENGGWQPNLRWYIFSIGSDEFIKIALDFMA